MNNPQLIQQILPLLIPVLIVQILLLVVALLDLRKQTSTRGPKWMWAIIIIFVNIIGPIIYFVAARKEE
ncbi:MAG: PLDc N-terminal domain-containing protein [Anaerolineaceae bacterium]|nr:PLDc N-terminal domain-containing protein [Anaerolineaceae bacterium]